MLMLFSTPEYMLEPPISDVTNDQELLDGMTTTNVYVAKVNQTNLELGENAILFRDMVKLNSKMMEAVVLSCGTKVLMNHTVLPHFLPKTLFIPPATEFEQHADNNVIRFHTGNKSQLGHDKAAFDTR